MTGKTPHPLPDDSPREVARQAHETLDALSEKYSGKQAYHGDMRLAIDTVRFSLVSYEAVRQAEFNALSEAYVREVDRERQRAVQTARDLERERAKQVGQKLPAELQELAGDLRRITVRPVEGSGVGEFRRNWRLSELEEACYNVRVAGGLDDTEVEVERRGISAEVPHPEMYFVPVKTAASSVENSKPTTLIDLLGLSRWTAYAALLASLAFVGIAIVVVGFVS